MQAIRYRIAKLAEPSQRGIFEGGFVEDHAMVLVALCDGEWPFFLLSGLLSLRPIRTNCPDRNEADVFLIPGQNVRIIVRIRTPDCSLARGFITCIGIRSKGRSQFSERGR